MKEKERMYSAARGLAWRARYLRRRRDRDAQHAAHWRAAAPLAVAELRLDLFSGPSGPDHQAEGLAAKDTFIDSAEQMLRL